MHKKTRRILISAGGLALLILMLGSVYFFLSDDRQSNIAPESAAVRVIKDNRLGEAYTLFAPLGSKTTYLINADGEQVHSWESQYLPGPTSYLLSTGNLLRSTQRAHPVLNVGGSGGGLELLDWEGNQLWEIPLITEKSIQHHDIEVMPNGNIMAMLWDIKSREEAIAAGMDPAIVPADGVWSERIIEININTSEIVWQWDSWNHVVQNFDAEKPNYGDVSDSSKINLNYYRFDRELKGDWLHFNSLAYNSALDQIMVVPHLYSELWVIDHGTTTEEAEGLAGDLLYRWGNPSAYGVGSRDNAQLQGGHNAHWIQPDNPESKVLIFNNGTAETGSSVLELALPVDASTGKYLKDDPAFGPQAPAWSFSATPNEFYSPILSTSQRLPNGNTLILNGRSGVIFEVTGNKKVVWKYLIPGKDGLPVLAYSAERHYADSPTLKGRRLIPQGYIEPIDGDRSEAPAGSGSIQVNR